MSDALGDPRRAILAVVVIAVIVGLGVAVALMPRATASVVDRADTGA